MQKNCTKKDLHDHILSVISHLKPGILECEVKWALKSITTNKASGGDGIPVELFPVLWSLLHCPNLLAYWVQHFHSIIF